MLPQTIQSEASANIIDLGLGHPSPELLPLELLREAAGRSLARGDRSFLQYGYEQGDIRFRTRLAAFLSRRYAAEVGPEELFVSAGVSQALDLVCSLFTRPGDRVFVEEPTYFLALRIFADHGLVVEGLPTDRQGLIPAALEQGLRRGPPAMLYTVPAHQNPTGASLSEERRGQVLSLCRRHGVLLVADEVYHLLRFAGVPPPALGTSSRQGGVLSLGSFSKILAPGLRLGWVQGSPELLRRLAGCGFLDSGGGLAPFTSAIVSSLLEGAALEAHLDLLRGTYASRSRAMASSLEQALGRAAQASPPLGGFFFWARLKGVEDSAKLLPLARARGVAFVPGSRFSTRGAQKDFLRLSFSYYDEEHIREAVARLAAAVREA
jgi:2-aminoadipate transaminase